MALIRPFPPTADAATDAEFAAAVTTGGAGRLSAAERTARLPDVAVADDRGHRMTEHRILVADDRDWPSGFNVGAADDLKIAVVTPCRRGMGLSGRPDGVILAHARADTAQVTTRADRQATGFFQRRGCPPAPRIDPEFRRRTGNAMCNVAGVGGTQASGQRTVLAGCGRWAALWRRLGCGSVLCRKGRDAT